MESENEELKYDVSSSYDENENFINCKVIILRELLQDCRKDIGSLKDRYVDLRGEQREVHQILEEHRAVQDTLKAENENLKKINKDLETRYSKEEHDQVCAKLNLLTAQLDNVTSINNRLMMDAKQWDEQIEGFKQFYEHVKGLLSSDIEQDLNQNVTLTKCRVKQLEQELETYKEKFAKSDETHAQLLNSFKKLQEHYKATSQRQNKMMKYATHLMIPLLILLLASIIFQLFRGNALGLILQTSNSTRR